MVSYPASAPIRPHYAQTAQMGDGCVRGAERDPRTGRVATKGDLHSNFGSDDDARRSSVAYQTVCSGCDLHFVRQFAHAAIEVPGSSDRRISLRSSCHILGRPLHDAHGYCSGSDDSNGDDSTNGTVEIEFPDRFGNVVAFVTAEVVQAGNFGGEGSAPSTMPWYSSDLPQSGLRIATGSPPTVTAPLSMAGETFTNEMMWRGSDDDRNRQALCLALHWMQLAAAAGDSIARQRLEERKGIATK